MKKSEYISLTHECRSWFRLARRCASTAQTISWIWWNSISGKITMPSDEAIRRHPDLVNAYAVLQAAALVAEIQLEVAADRSKFTSIMKETVAQRIERREPLPRASGNFELA